MKPTNVQIAEALAVLEAAVNEMEEGASDTEACLCGLAELETALLSPMSREQREEGTSFRFDPASFEMAEGWSDDNHEAISFAIPDGVATEEWVEAAAPIVTLLGHLTPGQLVALQAHLTEDVLAVSFPALDADED